MPLKISWSRFAVLAATLLLPVKAGGCGRRTACFTLSQAAYAKNHDACPAAGAALSRFSDNSCGSFGPFASVDGEGSFDGEFCCYPVTDASNWFDCGGSGNSGVFGGVGGATFDTTSTQVAGVGGTGGTGGTGTTSTSTGGGGGMPGCVTCNEQLDGTSTDPGQLCTQAAGFWAALGTCRCGGGPCTMACSAGLCSGSMPDAACKTCMTDPSGAGCGAQLAACMGH